MNVNDNHLFARSRLALFAGYRRTCQCILCALLVPAVSWGGMISYTYDALNRLTKVRYPDSTTITYEYDAVGNWTVNKVTKPPTAAEVAGFTAVTASPGVVVLRWQTGVEFDVLGFQLERREGGGAWSRVDAPLIPAAGEGRPTEYQFEDRDVPTASGIAYRLVQVDLTGQRHVVAETVVGVAGTALIRATATGVEVEVRGEADRTAIIETAADAVGGPWVAFQEVKLDASGRGTMALEAGDHEPMRFYRVRLP